MNDKEVKGKISKKALEKAQNILDKYSRGLELLKKPLVVYNDRSILDVARDNQKTVNMYVDYTYVDEWQANVVRPTTRNKLRQIATRLLANLIYPAFVAQDEDNERDVTVAEVMDAISKWIITNSNYELEIIRAVMIALTDPVSYVQAGFYEIMRNVKRDGKVEQVVDQVLSGFRYQALDSSKILFPNLYVKDIQEQDWIIKHDIMSYDAFRSQFGEYKHANLVRKGESITYSQEFDIFVYEDDANIGDDNVLVIHYYDRKNDEEHIVANGILLTDIENPMVREDKLYPFAKFVYEEITGLFVGMPAATTLMSDQDLIDSMWNLVFDTATLANRPPMVAYGETTITGDILTPGHVTKLSEDSKVERLFDSGNGLQAGLAIIANIERSMEETASPTRAAGVADPKEMTAVEFSGLEQNALQAIGLFAKQIHNLVKQLGILMVGDVKQYLTLPNIKDLTSVDFENVEYKTIDAPQDLMSPTSKRFSRIRFDKRLMSPYVDPEKLSFELLADEGLRANRKTYLVNPELFRRFKFHAYVSPEVFQRRNERLERALKLEVYDRAINNPIVNKQEITKDLLLKPTLKHGFDKYVVDEIATPQGDMSEIPGVATGSNLVKEMTGSHSLKTLLAQDGLMG